MYNVRSKPSPARPAVRRTVLSIFVLAGAVTAGVSDGVRGNSRSRAEPAPGLTASAPDHEQGGFTSGELVALLATRNAVSNLVCREVVSRYAGDNVRIPVSLRDRFEATVEVLDGRERYSDVRRNRKVYADISSLPGTWSVGEMTTMLRISSEAVQAGRNAIADDSASDNRLAEHFRFEVPADAHAWNIRTRGAVYWMGFEGDLWLSEGTGAIARLSWRSTHIAAVAGIAEVLWIVDYGMTDVAGQTVALPDSSLFEIDYSRSDRWTDRNQTRYTGCRRYGSASTIRFQ